ncbi:hypothetical protein OH687_11605 [Burkholderia anthina]|nr:hypothetical protein OH687_11605 [Burkholderia anthina]
MKSRRDTFISRDGRACAPGSGRRSSRTTDTTAPNANAIALRNRHRIGMVRAPGRMPPRIAARLPTPLAIT